MAAAARFGSATPFNAEHSARTVMTFTEYPPFNAVHTVYSVAAAICRHGRNVFAVKPRFTEHSCAYAMPMAA